MENNNSGYSTYLVGTGGEILDCNEIVVYNRQEVPDIDKIYTYNIDSVYKKLLESSKYVRINKNDEGKFPYNGDNGAISGFNVIIYIGQFDNPIGYTEFFNIQGKDSTTVNLVFKFSLIPGEIVVEIVNSLSQLYTSKDYVSKDFKNGDSLLEYLPKNSYNFLKNVSTSLLEYTPMNLLIENNGFSGGNILRGGRVINSDHTLYKSNIKNNLVINQYNVFFNKYSVFFYEEDIVISEWSGINYNILSLTTVNIFGNPISYVPSQIGYKTIPNKSSYIPKEIINFHREIAEVLFENGKYGYFDTIKFEWLDPSGVNKVIKNPWDINGTERKFIQGGINSNTIKNNFPEIINTWFTNYNSNNEVYLWIGNWIVIKDREKNNYIYSNIKGSFVTTTESSSIFIINDNTLLVQKEEGGEIIEVDGDNVEEDSKNKLSYSIGDKLSKSILNYFRKAPISSKNNIPKIITTFRGYMFYLENNKLKFL